MEDFFGLSAQAGDFRFGEDAEEDGELDMFAVVHEQIEELRAAFVAWFVRGDIVGAEEGSAVVSQRTVGHGRWVMSPRRRRTRRRA